LTFQIRETNVEDAYNAATVHVLSWQSAYKGIIPEDVLSGLSIDNQAKRFIDDYIKYKGKSFYYVAELDGRIIGNLCLSSCRDDDKPDVGEIIAIYLLEEYWGKGFGRELLTFAINKLKHMEFDEVIIWVLEETERARKKKKKSGFVHDGIKKEIYIGKPLVEIRYSLKDGK
jgi:RimJ/RimL family protein N-acetyltransferase